MAIEMVRVPSETPNISNIDDFVGLRYAYGNQNGYVIGKGNECSYTINGSIFKINSGRLVLQGVECDIDANGVEITVDNVATKQYYSVYLQVNLASNETKILATSDTASYPPIETGDDLTQNTTGTARIVLYTFDVQSGVISNVQKHIEEVKYLQDITIKNARKVNSLEIERDENGVLKIGDVVIPQRKLLWKGTDRTTETAAGIITLSDSVKTGDRLEIRINVGGTTEILKFRVTDTTGVMINTRANYCYVNISGDYTIYTADITLPSETTLQISKGRAYYSATGKSGVSTCTLYDVYKIIE